MVRGYARALGRSAIRPYHATRLSFAGSSFCRTPAANSRNANFDHVTIITEAGTNRLVTAYPSRATPPLPRGYQPFSGN